VELAGQLAALAQLGLLDVTGAGVIDGIQAGRVWQFEITQTWAVSALALMAVPILMVCASVTLPARANRVTNLVVASLYVVVSVANAVGESWAYYFGVAALLEVVALALVLRYAWAGSSRK
jgi:hypothetical protein